MDVSCTSPTGPSPGQAVTDEVKEGDEILVKCWRGSPRQIGKPQRGYAGSSSSSES